MLRLPAAEVVRNEKSDSVRTRTVMFHLRRHRAASPLCKEPILLIAVLTLFLFFFEGFFPIHGDRVSLNNVEHSSQTPFHAVR